MNAVDCEVLIYQGNFATALQQIKQLPIFEQQILYCKYHEKLGEFLLAEKYARSAFAHVQSQNDVVLATVSLLYSLWRQGRYAECHTVADLSFDLPATTATAKYYNILGLVYWSEAKYRDQPEHVQKAITLHNKSLQLRIQLQDTLGISFSYNNLGNAYLLLQEYATALQYYQQALSIREELQLTAEIATTLRDIGRLYYQQHMHTEALEYYTRAKQIREQISNPYDLKKITDSINLLSEDM